VNITENTLMDIHIYTWLHAYVCFSMRKQEF